MTILEAHKEQWNNLKDRPLREKLQHIVTYYWAPILACLCVIALLTSWIVQAVTQKEAVLSGYLLNAATKSTAEGDLEQAFLEQLQIDTQKYTADLMADVYYQADSESYYVLQAVTVRAMAGMLDFIVTDADTYQVLTAYYGDLRQILTADQLEAYQPWFVYVEQAELDALTDHSVDSVALPQYYSSSASLQDPVPIGIQLPETCLLWQFYDFLGEDVIFGFIGYSENQSNALEFLDYILQ